MKDPPGRYQELDLFIKVLRLLCPNLTDASMESILKVNSPSHGIFSNETRTIRRRFQRRVSPGSIVSWSGWKRPSLWIIKRRFHGRFLFWFDLILEHAEWDFDRHAIPKLENQIKSSLESLMLEKSHVRSGLIFLSIMTHRSSIFYLREERAVNPKSWLADTRRLLEEGQHITSKESGPLLQVSRVQGYERAYTRFLRFGAHNRWSLC